MVSWYFRPLSVCIPCVVHRSPSILEAVRREPINSVMGSFLPWCHNVTMCSSPHPTPPGYRLCPSSCRTARRRRGSWPARPSGRCGRCAASTPSGRRCGATRRPWRRCFASRRAKGSTAPCTCCSGGWDTLPQTTDPHKNRNIPALCSAAMLHIREKLKKLFCFSNSSNDIYNDKCFPSANLTE